MKTPHENTPSAVNPEQLTTVMGGVGPVGADSGSGNNVYTVQPGDTAWDISRARLQSLGRPVNDTAIANEVNQMTAPHNQNGALAANPNLIVPGQQITWNKAPGS